MRSSSLYRPAAEGSGGGSVAESSPGWGALARGQGAGYVVSQPIDLAGLLAAGHHPAAGAVVLFSGEVRDSNLGRAVAYLEYEAHVPLAEKMIGEILAEAKAKWGLSVAIAQHRIGQVEIGETAVVVITASPHRSEAYAANRHIIDRIKHEAPIWKCEHYQDGTKEWGNNCNCSGHSG
jgi:molybdopterin synthase catalytic subunit